MALQRMWASVLPSAQSALPVDLIENDPYKVLGLDIEAKEDDITKAYRQLSLKCHPDKRPDDADAKEKFQQISRAYQLLMDSEFRQHYSWAKDKLPSICHGLEAYASRPHPSALIEVYTAVFDTKGSGGLFKLEEILRSEVSHGMGELADCLRQPLHEPFPSWMKCTISKVYKVRNRLYCLQAGFAAGGKAYEFPLLWPRALSAGRQEAHIDELAQGFWQNVIKAVQHSFECAMMLSDLLAVWCRCSNTSITPLRVHARPHDKEAYDAMRAGIALCCSKLLPSPLTMPFGAPASGIRAPNRPMLDMVASFLSDEDLQTFYCLHRTSHQARRLSAF